VTPIDRGTVSELARAVYETALEYLDEAVDEFDWHPSHGWWDEPPLPEQEAAA